MNEYMEFCKRYSEEYKRIDKIVNNMTLLQITELKNKYQALTKSNRFHTTDATAYFARRAAFGTVII